MHDVIVQKYGGSSVADIEKLRTVAERVRDAHRSGARLVVVVSAMGKRTEELFLLAEQARAAGGAEQVPARELDMLATSGERVSMALLAIILHGLGIPATSLTGSQSGIITSNEHGNAKIIEVKPQRIEHALAAGAVAVVAGYQGMSQAREITTLGRGGSDTTAVALAAALSASRCEIYSDVDGVYTSDPRQVPDALHLPRVGYHFMQAMADAGAKVLSSGAVTLAHQKAVRIVARRTADGCGGRHTVVASDNDAPTARAVVERRQVFEVTRGSEVELVVMDTLNRIGIERLRTGGAAIVSDEKSIVSLIDSQSNLSAQLRAQARADLGPAGRILADDGAGLRVLIAADSAATLVARWHQQFVASQGAAALSHHAAAP